MLNWWRVGVVDSREDPISEDGLDRCYRQTNKKRNGGCNRIRTFSSEI